MVCLVVFDVFVVLHLGVVPFLISSYAHDLAFVLSFQGINNFLGVESCTNYFRLEGIGSLQQLFLPNILALVEISVKLGRILHIRSQESSVWNDFSDSLLRIQVILLRIGVAIVIVLNRCCEDDSIFLS